MRDPGRRGVDPTRFYRRPRGAAPASRLRPGYFTQRARPGGTLPAVTSSARFPRRKTQTAPGRRRHPDCPRPPPLMTVFLHAHRKCARHTVRFTRKKYKRIISHTLSSISLFFYLKYLWRAFLLACAGPTRAAWQPVPGRPVRVSLLPPCGWGRSGPFVGGASSCCCSGMSDGPQDVPTPILRTWDAIVMAKGTLQVGLSIS